MVFLQGNPNGDGLHKSLLGEILGGSLWSVPGDTQILYSLEIFVSSGIDFITNPPWLPVVPKRWWFLTCFAWANNSFAIGFNAEYSAYWPWIQKGWIIGMSPCNIGILPSRVWIITISQSFEKALRSYSNKKVWPIRSSPIFQALKCDQVVLRLILFSPCWSRSEQARCHTVTGNHVNWIQFRRKFEGYIMFIGTEVSMSSKIIVYIRAFRWLKYTNDLDKASQIVFNCWDIVRRKEG